MTESELTKILEDLYNNDLTPEDAFHVFEGMIDEEENDDD